MKKLTLAIAALSVAAGAFAQNNNPEKYAKYITAEDAKKHLSILASDEYEGRETGKPGADKAAHYLENEFKRLGLQAPVNGSYFLDIPLVENSLKITGTLNGQEIVNGKDFVAGRGSIPDKTVNATEVAFVGYGTDAEIGDDEAAAI